VWHLEAGAYRAVVDAPEPMDRQLRAVLSDLRIEAPGQGRGSITVVQEPLGTYAVHADGRLWDDGLSQADVVDSVVHMLLRAALDAETSMVHIHAGAVTHGERALVMGGWSASGKSTAITCLVRAGFGYVTDERLVVEPRGAGVRGFPKPISLIEGSFAVLADLDPVRTGVGATNGSTWQLPASSLGALARRGCHRPAAIVFVGYTPGGPLRMTQLSPAVAAARLLSGSPDVIARGPSGAQAIVDLAASVPSVDLAYSVLADLPDALRELMDQDAPMPGDPAVVLTGHGSAVAAAPTPNDLDPAVPFAVAAAVSVWVLGNEAVAFSATTGRVAEIGATNAAWLQLLSGRQTLAELIAEMAEAEEADRPLVEAAAREAIWGLWSAGVVGPVAARGLT
jgi:hypothetical protein